MRKSIHIMHLIFILTGIVLLLPGCEKEEGEGGTSSISGRVFVNDYDSEGNYKGSYYSPDEDVYIIYGNNSYTYDDHFKTSFDGSYQFEYLTRGNYTVFAYSDCDTCSSGTEVVTIRVEITENKKDYELNDLVVRR